MQRHCRLDRLLWSYSVTLQWLIPTRYQSAINSRSQPSFFLPSSHSKQRKIRPLTKKNSLSLLSTAHVGLLQSLHDQPSTCPFCAPGGPKSAQSFHRQTFYSGRGLVWPKTRMWDLDLREVGHVSIFNEVTESRWSHVLEVVPGWRMNGASELVYRCASPASVDGGCFLGVRNSKGSLPTHTKIQKLDGKFYFKFTSPSSRNFCIRREVIRVLSCTALFRY